jgi:arabinogalactan endo-1,4-beta-galactosidase
MKIRIKSNSLRYRLTRSEVERFAQEGVIKEKIQIGDEALTLYFTTNGRE